MKKAKLLWLMIAALFITGDVSAQLIKDPTAWTYEAKRKFGNHFEVFFHVKLANPWHIYALNPGSDESLLPPKFTFTPAKNYKLVGDMKELGKPTELVMDGIDGKVRLFTGEATFIQEVEVIGTAAIILKGEHEYQVCNDQICLPPKKKPFSVSLKP